MGLHCSIELVSLVSGCENVVRCGAQFQTVASHAVARSACGSKLLRQRVTGGTRGVARSPSAASTSHKVVSSSHLLLDLQPHRRLIGLVRESQHAEACTRDPDIFSFFDAISSWQDRVATLMWNTGCAFIGDGTDDEIWAAVCVCVCVSHSPWLWLMSSIVLNSDLHSQHASHVSRPTQPKASATDAGGVAERLALRMLPRHCLHRCSSAHSEP